MMKLVRFVGSARDDLRAFPDRARHRAGFQLACLQRGEEPRDWKPMPSIGPNVREIRVWDESGTYRVIYTAAFPEAIYVRHAFEKKTQKTSERDVALARQRLATLVRTRKP